MSQNILFIPEDKIVRYLLNINHVKGASKAKFFLGKGFSLADLDAFAIAIATQAVAGWPGTTRSTPYGMSHEVVGAMKCPDGSSATVKSVWLQPAGEPAATLVTAYPS